MAYIIYILFYIILYSYPTENYNHMNFNTVEKYDTFDHTILVKEKLP